MKYFAPDILQFVLFLNLRVKRQFRVNQLKPEALWMSLVQNEQHDECEHGGRWSPASVCLDKPKQKHVRDWTHQADLHPQSAAGPGSLRIQLQETSSPSQTFSLMMTVTEISHSCSSGQTRQSWFLWTMQNKVTIQPGSNNKVQLSRLHLNLLPDQSINIWPEQSDSQTLSSPLCLMQLPNHLNIQHQAASNSSFH